MKRLFPIALILILITSCASLDRGEAPDWVSSQPRILGSVVFVGRGEGYTREEARTNAYDDVLNRMSENLGRNLSSQYLRELLSRGAISDLSTTVEGEYSAIEDGLWTFYVMTVTPSRSFRDSRSPEYLELLDREERIGDKIKESISFYSENKDIAAVDSLLDAIEISLEGDVNNPEYTEAALLERAVEYISRIRISVDRTKKKEGEVTVRVKRARGMFHPSVIDGYVYSRYDAVNTDGQIVSSGFISKTGRNGRFFFNRTDPYMLRSSYYEFSPYLDENKLSRISERAGSDFLSPLYSAIESVSVTHDFHEKERLSEEQYVVAISVYDIAGNQLDRRLLADPMREQLEKAGIASFRSVEGYGEDSNDSYELLSRLFPESEYYFILRAGIVDRMDSIEKIYVRADAIVSLYDSAGNLIKSQSYYTSGDSSDLAEAVDEAFSRIARISAGFFLAEL